MTSDASSFVQPSPVNITATKQLLVEGQDDRRVFQALMDDLGIVGVQIQVYDGKSKFRGFLKNFVEDDNFERVKTIGIHRDADTSAASAEQSVQDALRKFGLPRPSRPLSLATRPDLPSVTYIIVPPGKQRGAIEDVCIESVIDEPASRCVEEYMNCLSTTLDHEISDKARVQAYLASLRRPNLRLGEAAEGGYWNLDAPSFEPMRKFLRLL